MNSSDHAYEALRTQILTGRIPPGTALKERDLCELLNVSRTPVREALRRLSADGLAEVRPRRSIIVSSFDEHEIAEIFEVGIVLESFVAGLAARKATTDDLNLLGDIVEQMAACLHRDEPDRSKEYVALDQVFHDAIAAAARNPRITQILRQTMSVRVLSNIFSRYSPGDFENSLAQHRIILRAITERDVDWAQAAMGSHIRAGQAAQRIRARD